MTGHFRSSIITLFHNLTSHVMGAFAATLLLIVKSISKYFSFTCIYLKNVFDTDLFIIKYFLGQSS